MVAIAARITPSFVRAYNRFLFSSPAWPGQPASRSGSHKSGFSGATTLVRVLRLAATSCYVVMSSFMGTMGIQLALPDLCSPEAMLTPGSSSLGIQ